MDILVETAPTISDTILLMRKRSSGYIVDIVSLESYGERHRILLLVRTLFSESRMRVPLQAKSI